jgi:DNA uptake protein ComE-like DNA-binding protein
MWKDYLYLNKRERSAFWIFSVFIILMQLGIWTSGKWLPMLAKSLDFKTDTIQTDSTIYNHGFDKSRGSDEKLFSNGGSYNNHAYGKLKTKAVLQEFDPNKADSVTLVSLGISPYVAKNIMKYRQKGGSFRKPEDFARIYGLETSLYQKLLPYICVGSKQNNNHISVLNKEVDNNKAFSNNETEHSGRSVEKADYRQENLVKNILSGKDSLQDLQTVNVNAGKAGLFVSGFELNAIDTSSLQMLKGVGPATASRIKKYGNQLGGYYDVSQLSEIKGLYPNVLALLQKSLTVDPTGIRKININKASLEKLKAHPYIDFYQAKVIIGLRTSRKGIKDLRELSEFKEFSAEDLEKLKWYLEI